MNLQLVFESTRSGVQIHVGVSGEEWGATAGWCEEAGWTGCSVR